MRMKSARIFASLDPFVEAGAVLGRRVANQGFLHFLLAADPFDEYHFYPVNARHGQAVYSYAQLFFPSVAPRVRVFPRLQLPDQLQTTAYHCFHLSDCITNQASLARLRNRYSQALFPITGTTHSLSYAAYPQAFLRHLWPGATPRDAILATSSAGKAVVNNILAGLRAQYGLKTMPGPAVECIPLGVDAEAMTPASPAQKQAARDALRLLPGQTAVLTLGRIQHHSKMDLVPLLRAFQHLFADGLDAGSAALIVAGWADEGDDLPATLQALADNIGLDLRLELRPDDDRKALLFAAADVFCSPSDNPQETFGLTLLEAGACGLPVVASDYDGYRDLVVHEQTGLLVPTLGPAGTADVDDLAPLVFDTEYHLLLAQQTVVQVPQLAAALGRLLADQALRQRLGAAARTRVRENFSWSGVVQAHLAMWDRLWQTGVEETAARNAAHPLHMDYGRVFAAYPSQTLHPGLMVRTGRTGQAVYRGKDHPLIYAGLEEHLDPDALHRLLFLARKPVTVQELARQMRADNTEFLILWAIKHDLLQTV